MLALCAYILHGYAQVWILLLLGLCGAMALLALVRVGMVAAAGRITCGQVLCREKLATTTLAWGVAVLRYSNTRQVLPFRCAIYFIG